MVAPQLGYLALVVLFLAACRSAVPAPAVSLTPEAEPVSAPSMTQAADAPTPVIWPTATKALPTATAPPTATSTATAMPTPPAAPTSTACLAIHEQPGKPYETLFSLPVGGNNTIQYFMWPGWIAGPSAIAVLPDGRFVIADQALDRLLYYTPDGRLLKIIKLEFIGIGPVKDLRAKGNDLYLLETGYEKYRVHRLTLDGEVISSDVIPHRFPIGGKVGEQDMTLENALMGIAVDCEGNIILEVEGSMLFHLSDVQTQSIPDKVTDSYFCNSKRYWISTPGLWQPSEISVGDATYQTHLTMGGGGIRFLDVFPDDSFYAIRDDMVYFQVIKVDQTVHYVGADGVVQGMARVPLSEHRYPVERNVAIGPNGEVFALVPRPNSLDIVWLNFYKELEPLLPDAVSPNLTLVAANPPVTGTITPVAIPGP
jgi:hypothetical protein